MKEIVNAIDSWINTEYAAVTKKTFGYCELMRKTIASKEQVFPATIPDRAVVSLNDQYNLITWCRLPGTIQLDPDIEGQNWAFGLNDAPVQKAGLRLIVAHKVSLGESFINTFIKNIPLSFDVNGFEIVSVNRNDISVDADHESIYKTELGETVYEKHRITWNIYAITLNVEFIPCEEV